MLCNFSLTASSGLCQTSCMRRSFHSCFKCFHFSSQPLLRCSRKSSVLLTAYACATWVSQTLGLIITTRLQCHSCKPVCFGRLKKNCFCLSLWVNSVVEISRSLLSGDKLSRHFWHWDSWGECQTTAVQGGVCSSPGNSTAGKGCQEGKGSL